MYPIDKTLYNQISFPDYSVISIEYNLPNKELVIKLDGIYIENMITDNSKACVIYITRWNEFQILEYKDNQLVRVKNLNIPHLKDICESSINPDHIEFKGFDKECGLWTEYHFYNAFIKIDLIDK